MEKILEAAANQVPGMVVLVVVVVVFLRAAKSQAADFTAALRDQRASFIDSLRNRDERTGEISEECHAVAREATSAVRENTRVLGGVEKTIDRTNRILEARGA